MIMRAKWLRGPSCVRVEVVSFYELLYIYHSSGALLLLPYRVLVPAHPNALYYGTIVAKENVDDTLKRTAPFRNNTGRDNTTVSCS
eukprot:scaffold10856_cov229-Amphora_coffeaeformis.AAC.10